MPYFNLLFCSFSVPPSIFGSNNMVAVVVNNLVRLECEARGIPAPSLTWLKDGSPVTSFVNGIQVLCHFLRQIYHLIIHSTKSDQIKPRNLQNKGSQMLSKNVHIYIYKYGHTTGISRQFIKSSGYLRVPLSHIVLYFDYCFRYFCFPIPTLWYHHKR